MCPACFASIALVAGSVAAAARYMWPASNKLPVKVGDKLLNSNNPGQRRNQHVDDSEWNILKLYRTQSGSKRAKYF